MAKVGDVRKNYKIVSKIGGSSVANVFLVTNLLKSTEKLAMKIISKVDLDAEITIALSLSQRSPFLVKLKEVFSENDEVIIVMEYCPGDNLAKRIEKHQQPGDVELYRFFFEIAITLKVLHMSNIFHLHVKPSNVFCFSNGGFKLGDYGIAGILKNTIDGYTCPEVIQGEKPFTQKADVFSLGATVMEFMLGFNPFSMPNKPVDKSLVAKGTPSSAVLKHSQINHPAIQIGLRMIAEKPAARPDIDEILNFLYDIFTPFHPLILSRKQNMSGAAGASSSSSSSKEASTGVRMSVVLRAEMLSQNFAFQPRPPTSTKKTSGPGSTGGGGDIPPPPPLAVPGGGGDIPPPPLAIGGESVPPPPPLGGGNIPPPPPVGGVPPPPPSYIPPAPGAPEIPAVPKKPSVKPNKPMKPLRWSRLPDNKIEGTVWKQWSDEKVKLDIAELERLFEVKPNSGIGGSSAEKEKEVVEKPVPHILDGKRIHLVGITLSNFPGMSPEEIADAIDKSDMKVLTPDRIRAVCKVLPTVNEVQVMNDFRDDPSTLTRAERFFLKLNKILHIQERLQILLFRIRSEEMLEYLGPSYDTFNVAAKEVSTSESLRSVFEMILAIGNYLNGGTSLGGAYGMKLDVLLKIADFKSADNNTTLFEYLVHKLRQNNRSHEKLITELTHIPQAANLAMQTLVQDMQEFSAGVNLLSQEVAMIKNSLNKNSVNVSVGAVAGVRGSIRRKEISTPISLSQRVNAQAFVQLVEPFHQSIPGVYKKIVEKRAGVEKRLNELITRFNEDPRKMPADEFFHIIASFVASVEKLAKDMDTKEEQARKDKEVKQKDELRKQLITTMKAKH